VYPFVGYLAQRFDCKQILSVGEPGAELMHLHPQFRILGIISDANLAGCNKEYPSGTWLKGNLDGRDEISLDNDFLKRAAIVCTGLIDRMADPAPLLRLMKNWLNHSPICVLTCADRDLNSGNKLQGLLEPVRNSGRWNLVEFERYLRDEGFKVEFIGWTANDDLHLEKTSIVAVITGNATRNLSSVTAPSSFKVVGFMAAYNEEDIIVQSIRKWTDQGIHVHILENWSTDASYELAKSLESTLPLTVERFPRQGPSRYFDWGAILARIEELSREIEADWFVRRGVDEVLMSPWPRLSYKDGLYLVDQAGFNCVDHTLIEFYPVDNGFEDGGDHESYFRHFSFGRDRADFLQIKAWKNYGRPIVSVPSGGHTVSFEGSRVYPFKFLIKHYPVRSQQHGEKKVFRERKARWNPDERAKGWHVHYDAVEKGHQFVRPAARQEVFDESQFNRTYLVERLSGLGIIR
jgi:hypothetical protein